MLHSLLLVAAVTAQPTLAYTVRVDARDVTSYDVTLRVTGAPDTLRLAMAVHPEEDNAFWRYLRDLRIDGGGTVMRQDSTLWRVVLPKRAHGAATIRWRFAMPPAPAGLRGSWRPFLRPTGALVGGMDGFLYLPDFPGARARVTLDVPQSWRIATALTPGAAPRTFTAPDAATLVDAPILMGDLRTWRFDVGGGRYRIAYWPLPNATPFDTTAFVDGIARLVRQAVALGLTPVRDYTFLVQDGATAALEHARSVTLGITSRELADDVNAHLGQTAHEFFHTWNIVRVRPAGWGTLSFRPTAPTPSLWWSEGVTMYFADALLRRAGLGAAVGDRAQHVAERWESYLQNPANARISPERASLAAADGPGATEASSANLYGQGELLGLALDATIRDSTVDRRGIDDVMRALDRATSTERGFTPLDLEHAASRACGCDLHAFFEAHVRGTTPPDVAHAMARVGLRLVLDSSVAADDSGRPVPDLRVFVRAAPSTGGYARLMQINAASAWAATGLPNGIELVAMNGTPVASFSDFRRVTRTLAVGDQVALDVIDAGTPRRVILTLASWRRPRVQAVDDPNASAAQRARRIAWNAGR